MTNQIFIRQVKDDNQNDKNQHVGNDNVSFKAGNETVKIPKTKNEDNIFDKLPEDEEMCLNKNNELDEIRSEIKVKNLKSEESLSNTKVIDASFNNTDNSGDQISESGESESSDLFDIIVDNVYECEVLMDHLTVNAQQFTQAVECLKNVKMKKEKKLKEALERVKNLFEEDDMEVILKNDSFNKLMQQLTTLRK